MLFGHMDQLGDRLRSLLFPQLAEKLPENLKALFPFSRVDMQLQFLKIKAFEDREVPGLGRGLALEKQAPIGMIELLSQRVHRLLHRRSQPAIALVAAAHTGSERKGKMFSHDARSSSCRFPGLQGDLQPSHLFRQLLLCHVHPAEDQPAQKAFPEQSFSPVALLFDLLNVVHQPLFPGDLPLSRISVSASSSASMGLSR